MADDEEAAALELKKKRTFRKFTYRGIDLDNLLDLTPEQLVRRGRRSTRGPLLCLFTGENCTRCIPSPPSGGGVDRLRDGKDPPRRGTSN